MKPSERQRLSRHFKMPLFVLCMPLIAGTQCPNNGMLPGTGFPHTTAWTQTTINNSAGIRPSAILAADFDGDQLTDIAVGYQGFDTEPAAIVILFRQDDDTFTPVTLLDGDAVAGVARLASGDLDGDTRRDLVAACNGRIVYLHAPAGARTAADWDGFEVAQSAGDGIGPWNDVAVVNIDSANGPDIIACGQDAGRVSWFRSPAANIANGTGWQRVDIDAATRAGAASIEVADLNGDNRLDVLSTAPGEDADRIAWYANPANPVSQTWTKFPIGNLPAASRMVLGDLNVDGRSDVIVTNPPGRQVAWYVRPADATGDWTGFLITQYGAATPVDLAVTDVDGNSQPDIVVATRAPGSLRWFTPVGPQTNQWVENNVIDLAADINAGRIVLDDFDGDGRRDVFGCILGANTNQDAVVRWDNPE